MGSREREREAEEEWKWKWDSHQSEKMGSSGDSLDFLHLQFSSSPLLIHAIQKWQDEADGS